MRARWADYFEQLYKADPPVHQIDISDDPQVLDAPPVNTSVPSLLETRKAVAQLKNRRAAGICGISPKLLKYGGEAVCERLYMQSYVLLGTLVSSRLTGRGASLSHSGKARVISLTAITTEVLHTALCTRQGLRQDYPWQNPTMPYGRSAPTTVWFHGQKIDN